MIKIELHSARLKLRLIEDTDWMVVHGLHSLPETDEFNTLGIPKNTDETKMIIDSWIADHQQQEIKNYTFAVEQSAKDQFIGLITLKVGNPKYRKAEVWYKIHVKYWGQGFATEALNRILDFGLTELKLHRIEAGCAVDNIGSIKVLEKVGMIKEGRKRQVLPLKSGWSDNFEYAIIETDKRLVDSTMPVNHKNV
ncbi:GNAT family N-acetyltransferase [Adhaeribacter arboris]|uniref:GNAT family N-acetyltransferase n=1 Tax=Adhaeribacter arboris TaxID=2072846 RepID=A0A2T2Y9S8_9BACT|nr:GNAT family N-acetyltransferase [Adhaeribacter arboris]PSR52280.1 GNAT family N-acetyltransferase [Adhaeribacter arboris]